MGVSVVSSPGVVYPGPEDGFSPSEAYPEYPFDHVARQPNAAYALVRRALSQAGLDAEHFGQQSWNPLGSFVPAGARVFVLCNFVYHRRPQESRSAFRAKCIHGSVLRAVCDYALLAAGPGGSVRFGNAPLQSTDWDRVLAETEASVVLDFYRKRELPVSARDLRLYLAPRSFLGRVLEVEQRDEEDAVEVGLGEESLLHEIAWNGSEPARFRIADYPPERIEAFHRGGRHRYVIHRDVLDADVVISLSKLKTHEKVGITCALKGFVGMVGHKDCLAHHRFGSPGRGGDEYPRERGLRRRLSRFHDWVNGRGGESALSGLLQIADRNVRRVMRRLGVTMAGAWYGNDTCWRMALDLARIAHFADAGGTLHDRAQRRHLSFIDGITAGEGDGPLVPTPVEAGTVVFSDDVVWGDRVAAALMGFDPDAIPLLRGSLRPSAPPLADDGSAPRVVFEGEPVEVQALRPILGRAFRPPHGWRGHVGAAR